MINIGILVFPQVEELDFIGPFEVLSYINKVIPDSTKIWLISNEDEMVTGFNGLKFSCDYSLANCPHLDVLVVPGGQGRKQAMQDEKILNFINTRYKDLKFLVSVCTGALILASTGLLQGKRATTYHTAMDELAQMDVITKSAKVVQDGIIITGAGVSSGIDVGLYLLGQLFSPEAAQLVADKIEYNWQK